MQVSIMTKINMTHGFDKHVSRLTCPQLVVQTKHMTIPLMPTGEKHEWLCMLKCVHAVGAVVETLKGECEKCAEGTQCSSPLPLSVSSKKCA